MLNEYAYAGTVKVVDNPAVLVTVEHGEPNIEVALKGMGDTYLDISEASELVNRLLCAIYIASINAAEVEAK